MSQNASNGARLTAFLLTAALLAAMASAVYLPGLPGGFAFDDFHTIVENKALAGIDASRLLDAALSTDTGPFKRPLAMLSFAASLSASGLDPGAFKAANIAIHAFNAMLVLVLLRRITPLLLAPGAPAAAIATVAAALWAVHPINLTAVLYVVQRMTTLSSTFVLFALVVYAGARCAEIGGRQVSRIRWALVPAAGLIAVLVKETALLLPLYLLVLETHVFRYRGRKQWRRPVFAALVLLAVGLLVLIAARHPVIFGGYANREFTPVERLLTEARVLMVYLRLIVVPDLGVFGLFHDDFIVSRTLLSPWTTLPAVLAVGAMAVLACQPRARVLAFACAWYLGGHLLESSIYPLELAHEHRNYLSGLGVLVALVVYAEAQLRRAGLARLRALVAASVVFGFAFATVVRAQTWADPLARAEYDALHHPTSARSMYEVGRERLDSASRTGEPALEASGLRAMSRAAELDPLNPMPLVVLLNRQASYAGGPDAEHLLARVAALPAPARTEVLRGVIQCQAYGGCAARPTLVSALADIVIRRPVQPTADARRAVEWLAIYYLRVLGDIDAGVAMLRDIVTQSPADPALATRLAEALAANGHSDEARTLGAAIARSLPWHAALTQRTLWRRVQRVVGG